MKQALPALALLAACNAGPLQTSDAQTWSATDAWVGCESDAGADAGQRLMTDEACRALENALVGSGGVSRPARQVTARALTVGFDRCMATLRADDTIEPASCHFDITERDQAQATRRYVFTLSAASVDVTRESWRVLTQTRWTLRGTVAVTSASSGTFPILGRAVTSTVLLPVR